jgi:hypothetical protein
MTDDQLAELEDLRSTVQFIKAIINEEQNERIQGGRANWKRACDRIFNEVDGRADE